MVVDQFSLWIPLNYIYYLINEILQQFQLGQPHLRLAYTLASIFQEEYQLIFWDG